MFILHVLENVLELPVQLSGTAQMGWSSDALQRIVHTDISSIGHLGGSANENPVTVTVLCLKKNEPDFSFTSQ